MAHMGNRNVQDDLACEGAQPQAAEQGPMTARQWMALAGITCSAFVLNTSEFMPMGLLVDISSSFGISEATGGIMITAYAWAVTLLSLPLMMAASRIELKRLLIGVLAVFSIGQVLSAVAPTYAVLTASRIVVACAHAVFWSIASVMATRLVSVRHAALALSVLAAGTSIAMIFGLPLGRAIGLAVGWRMTFAAVGAVTLALMVYLAVVLPTLPTTEAFTLSKLPGLFKNRLLLALYAVTVLFSCAYYVGYSYIEPFLQDVAQLDPRIITAVLTVFGFAGLVGSALFSRLYDGHRRAFLACAIGGLAIALLALAPLSGSLVAIVAVCSLWGCCATAFNVAFQSEVIGCVEPSASSVAMSMFSGLFNFGIGAGSAIGGAVVASVGVGAIGYAGGLVGTACWLLAVTVLFRLMRVRGATR